MSRIFSIFGICLLICSCSTSKFDYQNAYKFSKYNYQKQQEQQQEHTVEPGQQLTVHTPEQPTEAVQALVSLKPVVTASQVLPSDKALKQMSQPAAQSAEAFATYYKNASKKEKKAIRKQVREDYKTLHSEYKKAKKEEVTQDVVFNKKMFIGVVVLGAGILIAILAHGGIGAVAIIVGIGLIAWGFIEQA